MTDTPVRVRFAPSPTGYLHIGGARTALFNWMYARKHDDGKLILRIEDTDQKRYVADSERDIMEGLKWLGIDWDEGPDIGGPHGPYRQSERSDLYREWADWLIENDKAYRCNATAEELKQMREEQIARGETPGYDRRNRDANLGPDIGPHVVRFKMPLDGETTVHDAIRGPITFQNDQLSDLVLLKADGLPTYHLANVVDDHFMEITHIMRADEWISSAPIHWQLYNAFGWQMPEIVHLPVILSPSGKGKLSKRDQAFQDGNVQVLVQVREFKEAGYLPEALVNFLMNNGWAFGDDREVFTPEEAFPRFELEDINPAGGKMPYEKLEWLNGVYIREMEPDELAARIKPYLEDAGLEVDDKRLKKVTPLIQERIKTLSEAEEIVGFIFRNEITIDDPTDLIQKKMDAEGTHKALLAAHQALSEMQGFDPDEQEALLRQLAKDLGLKAGQLFGALRVATTGQRVAPPLFETMEVIGKQTSLERIEKAAALLEAHTTEQA